MKRRSKKRDDPGEVFYDEAEDEGYKRYKHARYRNLILKALLAFLVGLLFCAFLKLA